MKKVLLKPAIVFCMLLIASFHAESQVLQWRLTNSTFNATDPDGTGPATGVATFTLQIRTASGTVNNITGLSTGWSWQTSKAMLPTGPVPVPTCGTNSIAQPSNVTMSSTFTSLGFTYNNVNQCSGSVSFTTGGQTFDRRAVGTVDGGSINLTTTWVDVFTVTLWAIGTTEPKAGYVVINSGAGATEGGPFSTYSVSDAAANEYVVVSQTFGTPLALGTAGAPLPVEFTRFDVQCADNGTNVRWNTAFERNNSHFEVEKSMDGTNWTNLGRVNSNNSSNYQFTDKSGGAALYRVKQVDLDGSITYTNFARTSCNSKAFYVNLYPIPAKDKLTIVIGSDKTVNTTAQVLDNTGRVVMNVRLAINKGTNNFTLNIGHLAQGQYYLRNNQEGININQQFTINR